MTHHDLTDDQLMCLLSAMIAGHHKPRLAYASRTFLTAAHVRQETPHPADTGVGGELMRVE